MINYCLDTNIISYLLKNDKRIVKRLKKEIVEKNEIAISLITYYEVLRGLYYINGEKKLNKFKDLIGLFTLLELNEETFEKGAKVYSDLRKNGNLIDDAGFK